MEKTDKEVPKKSYKYMYKYKELFQMYNSLEWSKYFDNCLLTKFLTYFAKRQNREL